MVALALFGIFSLVAGVCLFLRSPAAWGLARTLLRLAAVCCIALFVLGVYGMVKDHELLERAREYEESARRFGGLLSNLATAVALVVVALMRPILVVLIVWVPVLSETAGRLARHLPPARGADPPSDPLSTGQPASG